MKKKFRVFLSHASIDKQHVRRAKLELERHGITCWLDEDEILIGDSIVDRIDRALQDSRFVIFFVSEISNSSHWVNREIQATLARQLEDNESRILPALLDGTAPPALLKDFLWADLRGAAWARGIASLAQTIQQKCTDDTAAIEELNLGVGFNSAVPDNISKAFNFIIISGISASGKDSLVQMMEERMTSSHHMQILTKYNTRNPRRSEPEYSNALSAAEFQQLLDEGEIIFPYRKRNERYGFSASQFRAAQLEGCILVAIFTEFSLVPKVVSTMCNAGAATTAFFIKAAKQHLERRTLFRNFGPAEIVERTRSIRQDFAALEQRTTFKEEYQVLWNGDDTALEQVADDLEQAIRKIITLDKSNVNTS